MLLDSAMAELEDDMAISSSWTWNLKHYALPIAQRIVTCLYGIYVWLTLSNMVIFAIKYIPTGYYMFKFARNTLVTSRERLKQKQMELEDIQLKIQIVNTKLCVCESAFTERAELLRREKERLRWLRSRVRNLIASDEALRNALEAAANCDEDLDLDLYDSTQEDEFVTELLKGDGIDRLSDKMDSGKYLSLSGHSSQNSIHSSLSEMDIRQNCRVKIVRVTNVYKVACLKHYIKQRRLRRANKRALLNKKMENIKNLLADWQKTLSMVINATVTNLSQDAMGDYSKPRDSASESDLTNCNDHFCDEYRLSCMHKPHTPHMYFYEDGQEIAVARDNEDGNTIRHDLSTGDMKCDCIGQAARKMNAIVEETGSQVAIEQVSPELSREGSEEDEPWDFGETRDLISL